MCQILFLNKVSGLLQHRYFPVNFAKLLRTTFREQPRWLILSDVAKLKEKKNRTHNLKMNRKQSKTLTRNYLFIISMVENLTK